jgi:hypothetical protein
VPSLLQTVAASSALIALSLPGNAGAQVGSDATDPTASRPNVGGPAVSTNVGVLRDGHVHERGRPRAVV